MGRSQANNYHESISDTHCTSTQTGKGEFLTACIFPLPPKENFHSKSACRARTIITNWFSGLVCKFSGKASGLSDHSFAGLTSSPRRWLKKEWLVFRWHTSRWSHPMDIQPKYISQHQLKLNGQMICLPDRCFCYWALGEHLYHWGTDRWDVYHSWKTTQPNCGLPQVHHHHSSKINGFPDEQWDPRTDLYPEDTVDTDECFSPGSCCSVCISSALVFWEEIRTKAKANFCSQSQSSWTHQYSWGEVLCKNLINNTLM